MVDMTTGENGQILIQGINFRVPKPFKDGHECSAGEANALNQTLAENLRNNFATTVKEAKDQNGEDLGDDVIAQLQEELDDYAAEYEFGAGRVGGPRDPVRSEAMRMAKEQIRDALKRRGVALKNVAAEAITAAAEKLLVKNPEILALAKERVEKAQAAASGDLADLVAAIPQKPEGEEASA